MYEFRGCSSCGALYTKSSSCSKGGFVDKFVRNPNKTPDSSQRPPYDCPRCGSLVDGLYCRHCALLQKKLKEAWFTICDEHKFSKYFLNTFESSNNDSNVVKAPQEPIVFNQDPGENSSQSPLQIDHHCCYGGGDLLDGIFYQRCTSLLNQDSSIISSSKIDSLLYEFTGELIFVKSIPPGIDEADCDSEEEIRLIEKLLYDNSSPRPPKEIDSENSDAAIEYFSPPPIPNDDYDSEWDILILEELLSNDSLSLSENESFHFDILSSPSPPVKPLDDDDIEPNLGILTVKVVGDIFEHYVLMPRLLPTQPTLASNEEKSPHLLSYQDLKAFLFSSKSSMMIYGGNIPILDVLFLHFYPL
nr:hypothetical protein [Tanacetum cinerariifolium]